MVNSLLIVTEQTLLHVPLMLGAYISFSLLKVPDLSIESAYIMGALMGSAVLIPTLPLGITLVAALCASFVGGALVGLISSLLTQKAGFPHLLSSIVTVGLFHGFMQYVSKSYVSLASDYNPLRSIDFFVQHPELPVLCIISLILISMCAYLYRTQIGYSFAVFGNNPLFFKNYSISTSFVFVVGVVLANGLAGVSGYLVAQSNHFYELTMAVGKALLCITALILGKSVMPTKPISVLVPIVGTCAYFSLQQLLLKVGFNLKYFTAFQAFLILCILAYKYAQHPASDNDNLGV